MVNLLDEYRQFTRTEAQPNPLDRDALLTDFLEYLAQDGKLSASEADWYAFGRSKGLNDDEIATLIESAATWISSSGEVVRQEAARWPTESPPTAEANPSDEDDDDDEEDDAPPEASAVEEEEEEEDEDEEDEDEDEEDDEDEDDGWGDDEDE
jgi:hypothetical protein